MIIREMMQEDQIRVLEIYKEGIDSGKATFTSECPTWVEWDAAHFKVCRYVAIHNSEISAFTAISPISPKPHYRGVAEVTIYVDPKVRNHGIGTALLQKLIETAPSNGFWCLYSSIFSTNTPSIKLFRKCGFRTIGHRERIAKDRFGFWVDTTLMEYRFSDSVVNFQQF